MDNNGFHRCCNATVRRFFEDFDLLPVEAKKLIWDSPTAPNFSDLRTAWQLAENVTLDEMLRRHVFEEERKQRDRDSYEAKREKARREKQEARERRRNRGRTAIYRTVLISQTNPKHARLVQRVSDEEAMRMLTTRKETKDVVAGGSLVRREFVGWKKEDKDTNVYAEFKFPQHICKMLHNSGGA